MAYDNLREFFDPDLLLPVGDKTYRIASPSADEGLRIHQVFADKNAMIDDAQELSLVFGLLGATRDDKTGLWSGGVYGEMRADGVSWAEIWHVGRTALMHFGMGATIAQIAWHQGVGDTGNPMPPEPSKKAAAGAKKAAPAKARATGRSRAPRARTAPTTRAGGRSTKSTASESGTTT
ncbi:hypothetical protein CH296_11230 [Rhodococcus sp. 14-2496-1d]|uniref:DUF7426 family protein n=1 Tax=Rhodococcus sp. 14-2496-1d TaxID=2023146 RepID=UPI000B9C6F80|nr:hypothetical protein [Rhodococcus sp. 14-2496-1d]OZF33200.1 hypothetical protein CH296_11230 [Rhodococcus sp. 14-2496-1d]